MTRFESVSTWKAPAPPEPSKIRGILLRALANEIDSLAPHRLRVAVDGYTAAGKSSFAHELAAELRQLGRPTLSASLDDFKRPWRDARQHGYDRTSGAGYYRNAHDFDSAQRLLLDPAGPGGTGQVVLCAHDPLTGADHRETVVHAPPNSVLVVDGIFAFRPEYNQFWDYRIWLHVPSEVSLQRGIERDSRLEGKEGAERLHRDRYHVAELIYFNEVEPVSLADVVVDNTDFAKPHLL